MYVSFWLFYLLQEAKWLLMKNLFRIVTVMCMEMGLCLVRAIVMFLRLWLRLPLWRWMAVWHLYRGMCYRLTVYGRSVYSRPHPYPAVSNALTTVNSNSAISNNSNNSGTSCINPSHSPHAHQLLINSKSSLTTKTKCKSYSLTIYPILAYPISLNKLIKLLHWLYVLILLSNCVKEKVWIIKILRNMLLRSGCEMLWRTGLQGGLGGSGIFGKKLLAKRKK